MIPTDTSTLCNSQRQPGVFCSDDSDEKSMELSAQDMEYVKRLKVLSVDLILDIDNAKQTCKKLGKEIFNVYKKAGGNSTEAGKAALERIFSSCCVGVRRDHISLAWSQIGDKTWRWQA